MAALVIAEHDNASVKGATLNTVTAALQCDPEVHVLIAGSNAGAAVATAVRGENCRGRGSGKSGETNVPRAARLTIQPSAYSSLNAATTVCRCTPSVRASVRVPGSTSPARNRPRVMSSAMAWAIWTKTAVFCRRSIVSVNSHRAISPRSCA